MLNSAYIVYNLVKLSIKWGYSMKKRYYILSVFFILIALGIYFAPEVTYTIDSFLVSKDIRPIFVVHKDTYKDGGTKEYMGLGYQVIRWHMLSSNNGGDGFLFGYEIYRAPNYRNVSDGPTKKLKEI